MAFRSKRPREPRFAGDPPALTATDYYQRTPAQRLQKALRPVAAKEQFDDYLGRILANPGDAQKPLLHELNGDWRVRQRQLVRNALRSEETNPRP